MRRLLVLVVIGLSTAVSLSAVPSQQTQPAPFGDRKAVTPLPGSALTGVAINAAEASSREEVEPFSGRLKVSVTDLVVAAGPVRLELERVCRPLPSTPGLLGSHWRLNWERRLIRGGSLAMIEDGDDAVVFTSDKSGGRFRAPSGDLLVFENGNGVRTRLDGVREVYDVGGRLVEEDHGNGVRVTVRYGPNARLEAVEGPYNTWLRFRSDKDGRLTAVEASTGVTAVYAFDGQRLPGEAAARAVVFGYGYDGDGRLEKASHSLDGETTFAYGAGGRVKSRKWSDGSHEEFVRDDAAGTVRHTASSGQVVTYARSKDGRRVELSDGIGKTAIEYDESGRPVKVTGPTEKVMSLKYDAQGRVETITDPGRGITRFEYVGETRRLAARTSPGEPRQTFHYTPAGYLHEVRAGEQTVLQMTYFPDGLLKSVQGLGISEQRIAYDDAGRPAVIADALGKKTQLDYDRRNNLRQVKDAEGGTTTWGYLDATGRLKTITNADNKTTELEYGPDGRLAKVTDPAKGVTEFKYDDKGRVWRLIDPTKLGREYDYFEDGRLRRLKFSDGREEIYQYTGANLTGVKHSSGAVWKFGYDGAGRLTSEEGPHGHKLTLAYYADGQVKETTDALGRKTKYTYDAMGRLETITDPAARTSRLEYYPDGRLKLTEDSLKRQITLKYDDYGRVKKLSRTAGDLLDLEYRDGRLVTATGPASSSVAYAHDDAGRVKTRTYANGEAASFKRDDVGRVLEATDALKHTWKVTYTRLDGLATVRFPGVGKHSCTYQYTPLAHLETITDARGKARSFGYDGLGRRNSETDALGRKTEIGYGHGGQVDFVKLPDGRKVERKYDLLGRLKEVHSPNEPVTSFEYDAVGNLSVEKRGDYEAAYKYDDLDRLKQATYQPAGKTVKYEYDTAGRRKSMEVVGVGIWTYKYDDRDRLTELKDPQSRVTKFGYDDAGRVNEQALPNGVTAKRTYDGRGRLKTLSARGPGDKVILDRKYEYDLAGNLESEKREGGKKLRYRYDEEDRLSEVAGPGDPEKTDHDAVGNILLPGNKAEYDDADQVKRFGEETFTFDQQGRLTGRERGGPKTDYVYDAAGRMVAVKRADKLVAEYGYDPQGRRAWKTVDGKTTHFIYDGLQPVLELDGDLKPARVWTQTPEVDRPIGFSQGDAVRYPLADAIGSVVALTGADGAVTGQWDYRPFGTARGETKGELGKDSPTGFAGREFDPETGLYYFRARYYDPVLGRFLTPDPMAGRLSNPPTLHRYQYALNNPQRYRDPLGTTASDIADGLEHAGGQVGRGLGYLTGWVGSRVGAALIRPFYWASGNTQAVDRLNRAMDSFTGAWGNVGDKTATVASAIVTDPLRLGQSAGELKSEYEAGHAVSKWQIAGTIVSEVGRTITIAQGVSGVLRQPLTRWAENVTGRAADYGRNALVPEAQHPQWATDLFRRRPGVAGFMDPPTGLVYLRPGMNAPDGLQILAHEGFHAWVRDSLERWGAGFPNWRYNPRWLNGSKFAQLADEFSAFSLQVLTAEVKGLPHVFPSVTNFTEILYNLAVGRSYLNWSPEVARLLTFLPKWGGRGLHGLVKNFPEGAQTLFQLLSAMRAATLGSGENLPDMLPIPDVTGKTAELAAGALAPFPVSTPSGGDPADPKKGQKPGTVATTVPPPRTLWPKDRPVALVLYGPAEESDDLLGMPKVTDKPFDKAVIDLIGAGFPLKNVTREDAKDNTGKLVRSKKNEANKVTEQKPAAGEKVKQRSPIVLTANPPYRECSPTVSIDNLTAGKRVDHRVSLPVIASARDQNSGLTTLQLTARGDPIPNGGFKSKPITFPANTADSGTQTFVVPILKEDYPKDKETPITISVIAENQDGKQAQTEMVVFVGGARYGLQIEHSPDQPALEQGVLVTIRAVGCPDGRGLLVLVHGDKDNWNQKEEPTVKDGIATVKVPGSKVKLTTDTVTVTIKGSTVSETATYRFSGAK